MAQCLDSSDVTIEILHDDAEMIDARRCVAIADGISRRRRLGFEERNVEVIASDVCSGSHFASVENFASPSDPCPEDLTIEGDRSFQIGDREIDVFEFHESLRVLEWIPLNLTCIRLFTNDIDIMVSCFQFMDMCDGDAEDESAHLGLGRNLRTLRMRRGLTQEQLASLCELPRSTIANVEADGSNPTLSVLMRLSGALHLSLDELLTKPRARCELFPPGSLPRIESRRQRGVVLQNLLPHPIPGMVIDRMEIPIGERVQGNPHAPGTHEYLYCERGSMRLWVDGESFDMTKGSVAAFPGDQGHSYENRGRTLAIGFSVVSLAPVRGFAGMR